MMRRQEKLHLKHKLTLEDAYFKAKDFNHSSTNSLLVFTSMAATMAGPGWHKEKQLWLAHAAINIAQVKTTYLH